MILALSVCSINYNREPTGRQKLPGLVIEATSHFTFTRIDVSLFHYDHALTKAPLERLTLRSRTVCLYETD